MAKRVVTFIECDICEEPAETFDEWKPFKTDLCDVHMKEIVQPLREHLQRVRAKSSAVKITKKRIGPSDREMRDWARTQGIEVGEKGRVPTSVRDAFVAAH